MYHTWGHGARCSRRVITARACARGPLPAPESRAVRSVAGRCGLP